MTKTDDMVVMTKDEFMKLCAEIMADDEHISEITQKHPEMILLFFIQQSFPFLFHSS